MPKESKGGGRKRQGREVGFHTEALVGFIQKYAEIISTVLLLVVLALGVYIRVIPAIRYGLELDANDPWIAYWEAKYILEHGLFNLEGLSDVKIFWWPGGRDILHGDYIGLAWLAAATYPIGEALGLTLKEWIALFPVFAGAASIVLAYALIRVIAGSRLGGLVAATLFAFLPGAIVRTKVGFVEKTGFATPFLSAFYLLFFLALTRSAGRKRLAYAVAAGVVGGSIAFLWGGYHLVTLSIALAVLLEPMFRRPDMGRLRLYALLALAYAAFAIASPKVSPQYFAVNIGAVIPLALAIYAVEANIDRIPLLAGRLRITPAFQAWLVLVLFIAAGIAVYTQAIGIANNRLLAVVGIREISPLVESVQENQPMSLRNIMANYGVALILAAAGMVIFVARLAARKATLEWGLPRAVVYALTIFMVYANLQLAYFLQMASYYAVVAAGFAVADMVTGLGGEAASKGKKPKQGQAVKDPLRLIAAGFVIVLIGLSAAYYGVNAYRTMSLSAPQILTSGMTALTVADPNTGERRVVVPLNKAWINALEWIKNNTREDALIVSWWDYGYWITVNTGRKTIADGSTYNETQIRFLARVLTGDEGEASYILRDIFRAEPNNTYIVFYEVFRGFIDTERNVALFYPMPSIQQIDPAGRLFFVAHGSADFQKSAQMLRIAYRVDPFGDILNSNYSSFTVDPVGRKWFHFPGFTGEPKKNVETVRNTLLYKMAISGIPDLPRVAVVDESTCGNLMENMTGSLMAVVKYSMQGAFQFDYLLPPPTPGFQPAAISISCPVVQQAPNGYQVVAVMVFIYQWTG